MLTNNLAGIGQIECSSNNAKEKQCQKKLLTLRESHARKPSFILTLKMICGKVL